jgi:hypothetical protein
MTVAPKSPRDQGEVDCYYRGRLGETPRYYDGQREIPEAEMTPDQIAEYRRGWDDQAASGDRWEDEGDF